MQALSMLRTKNGMFLLIGWMFIWLALEKVFFGEALFSYSANMNGYFSYTITLLVICVVSCVLAFREAPLKRIKGNRIAIIGVGTIGSIALGFLAAISLGEDQSLPSAVLACGTIYAFVFSVIFALWARQLQDLVFEYGLFNVAAISLIAIALSFLIVPSSLRSSPYGQTIVVLSPLLSSISLAAIKSVFDHPGSPLPTTDHASKPVLLSLLMLAAFSFLIHLLAYVEFIAPGYVPVSDENPYCFVLLFVAILALLAVLAYSGSAERFWDGVFVNILVATVILAFLVFFVVFVSISSDGTYSYDLTKMLRRIIKIVVFFTIAMIVYRNGMKAVPTFVFVLLLPSIISKLFQMALSSIYPEIQNQVVYYLAIIGFLLVVCWSLFLLFYTRGSALFFAKGEKGSDVKPHEEPSITIKMVSIRYGFTDRERDVLEYLSLGYSTQKMAELLYISANTVKTHVASIYRKTGTHSKQEIIDLVNGAGNGQ